jgi:threonine/homoserine/homoserine lactone efflux protein
VWSQSAALGSIFLAVALVGDSLWALTASAASGWVRRRPGVSRRADALAGGVYVALGATAALAGGRHA